jgi:dephospho-CoA kinase
VGLTGGIGAGKSEVAGRLAGLGAVVIDADRLAREVVAPGTEGFREVVAAFGDSVLDPAGGLDRAALARAVFDDQPARRRLEGIIHPRVRARTAELAAGAPPGAVVVNDVPLLVELGLAATYHLVVVVEAAEPARVARLARDRAMTEQQVRARIGAQAPDRERRAAADVLLANDGTRADLRAAVDALWRDRLVRFEANVRLHRPVAGPAELRIAGHDPTWPEQAARLAARIAHATGGRRVDHVGSTAVPGLPARDVLDLQLTVADLATADELATPLAEAGFPRLPGSWRDTPRPGPPEPAGPDGWQKRLHGGADPGRAVHLHVRSAGSPGWQVGLLLRDWLRADPAVRAEYAALKRRLAGTGLTSSGYAAAKEPWLDQVWPRARQWATDTGWHAGPVPGHPR